MRVLLIIAAGALVAVLQPLQAAECAGPQPWRSSAAASAGYSDDDLLAFYEVGKQMSAAYAAHQAKSAQSFAERYLGLAARYPCDWNYGNAVHNANAVLGLVALDDGNRPVAVSRLLAAGASPGSPQLDSFGPSLVLAKRLAEAGEFTTVEAYVRSIRRFWEAENTTFWGTLGLGDEKPMSAWLTELQAHRVPDFGMNSGRGP